MSHAAILWSNPSASASALIRAALVRPTFERLLELAKMHGLEVLRREWALLIAEGSVEASRAAVSVERILHHLELGSHAAAT